MNKNSLMLAATVAAFSMISGSCWANSFSFKDSFASDKFSVSLASGLLGEGKGREYVYTPAPEQREMSYLTWNIENTPIVNADLSWDVLPWLTFSARGWTTLNSGKSEMNDYDWQDDDNPQLLTDWSHHPDTRLNFANEFDLNAKIFLINQPAYKFGALLGYQQNRFSWYAKGGYGFHASEDENDDYIPGTALSSFDEYDPGEPIIGYRQQYDIPYFGLVGTYNYRSFELNGTVKYSPWVQAKDRDNHYGDKLFHTKANRDSDYYAVSVDAGYYVLPDTKLFTALNWTKFKTAKGVTSVADPETGESFSGLGGLSSEFYTLNLGLQYRF
ncbi:omptin family outer membrane protease [Acinetobacter sp. WZC-1]|uniref:omptin family outer membrane protease n=1 Tax=Acinetobacter sp. WZC-1 TaxID=3459034 RepID=UPI00403E31F9